MDPPPNLIDSHSNSSSHHSIELSVFIVFGILFVAITITISISFLIRCLRARSLLPPPSLCSLIRRLFAPPSLGDCAICLSPFKPNDQLRRLPLCSHAFHADCISTWLASNKTCPLCRSPLDHSSGYGNSEYCSGCRSRWFQELVEISLSWCIFPCSVFQKLEFDFHREQSSCHGGGGGFRGWRRDQRVLPVVLDCLTNEVPFSECLYTL